MCVCMCVWSSVSAVSLCGCRNENTTRKRARRLRTGCPGSVTHKQAQTEKHPPLFFASNLRERPVKHARLKDGGLWGRNYVTNRRLFFFSFGTGWMCGFHYPLAGNLKRYKNRNRRALRVTYQPAPLSPNTLRGEEWQEIVLFFEKMQLLLFLRRCNAKRSTVIQAVTECILFFLKCIHLSTSINLCLWIISSASDICMWRS